MNPKYSKQEDIDLEDIKSDTDSPITNTASNLSPIVIIVPQDRFIYTQTPIDVKDSKIIRDIITDISFSREESKIVYNDSEINPTIDVCYEFKDNLFVNPQKRMTMMMCSRRLCNATGEVPIHSHIPIYIKVRLMIMMIIIVMMSTFDEIDVKECDDETVRCILIKRIQPIGLSEIEDVFCLLAILLIFPRILESMFQNYYQLKFKSKTIPMQFSEEYEEFIRHFINYDVRRGLRVSKNINILLHTIISLIGTAIMIKRNLLIGIYFNYDGHYRLAFISILCYIIVLTSILNIIFIYPIIPGKVSSLRMTIQFIINPIIGNVKESLDNIGGDKSISASIVLVSLGIMMLLIF